MVPVFFRLWLHWLLRKDVAIAEIYGTSFITGVGLMSHGPNDLLFCLFFARAWKQSKLPARG